MISRMVLCLVPRDPCWSADRRTRGLGTDATFLNMAGISDVAEVTSGQLAQQGPAIPLFSASPRR